MTSPRTYHDGRVTLYAGDCLASLNLLADASVDSVVTDPPYHLVSIHARFSKTGGADRKPGTDGYGRLSRGFMGKAWDGGDIAFTPELWGKVFRVLKPGGHVAAFSGTRTYHRMAVAIEAAGFEIRDCLQWLYGSGFPKSHDVSKAIDRAAGAERERTPVGAPVKRMIPGADQAHVGWEKTNGRVYQPGVERPATPDAQQWQGWGTALKPACEMICLARKPLAEKTVAANVLAHGVGALNIDACRVVVLPNDPESFMHGERLIHAARPADASNSVSLPPTVMAASPLGRWPANVVHDGSDEVVAAFPAEAGGGNAGVRRNGSRPASVAKGAENYHETTGFADSGSAARFFYSAKADAGDRLGSRHPTVKPVDLMRWLARLITPKGGVVLDPFAGTGTTAHACLLEGFACVTMEREAEYLADIDRRMGLVFAGATDRTIARVKARGQVADAGPLFGATG